MANPAFSNAIAVKTFVLMILVCTPDLISCQIRYSIPEEMGRGDFLGNVAQDLGLDIPQLSGRKFRLNSEEDGDLMVNKENGILSIREKIDREHICGQENLCIIPFEIILENPLEVYRGEVEVLDVNDNSPTFLRSSITLNIAETMAPGARFPLESAEDPDVGINTVAAYTISSNEYFSLKTQKTEDGVLVANLLLEEPLDQELQSSFHLVLTATDGGIPQRSGTAQVLITVMDINDNPPVFDHEIYRGNLKENTPRGTLVMTVKANDLDEGLNAELTYSFSELTSRRVRELFSLDPHTGEIRVEGRLDFEETNSYSLNVQAVDHGSPAITGHSKVLIKIIDINDNAPEIKVTSGSSQVPENAQTGTLITLINVIDRDSGENGEVHCEISKNIPFRLQLSSKYHYKLITSDPLDREDVPQYNITVFAWDAGLPKLSTNKTIQIIIADVNDNTPLFAESSYNVYVMENNIPGASIYGLTVSDPDLDQNSYLSYSFREHVKQNSLVSTYVSINSKNGTIYALLSFDYEKLKNFQVHVQARDAGVPPLSSSTIVNVIILDQNDNPPIIVSPSVPSGSAAVEIVPQTAGQGYLVTKITAIDADSGQNARLFYQLQRSTDISLFGVGYNSGEIRTARNILQTDSTTQTFVILVKDNGQPSLSSIVTIQVSILENITDRITESSRLVTNAEYSPKSDLNLYLIIIFGSSSVLFLSTIIILIGIKCRQDRTKAQAYNAPSCCCALEDSTDVFMQRPDVKGDAVYTEAAGTVRPTDIYHYSVCLSPESAKSDFLFLKPYSTAIS